MLTSTAMSARDDHVITEAGRHCHEFCPDCEGQSYVHTIKKIFIFRYLHYFLAGQNNLLPAGGWRPLAIDTSNVKL